MEKKFRSRDIRWLILHALHEASKTGQAQRGGWVNHLMLREILSTQGYDLDEDELLNFCRYLRDEKCLEIERVGDRPPYVMKSKILPRGVRVIEGEENLVGVGIGSGRKNREKKVEDE